MMKVKTIFRDAFIGRTTRNVVEHSCLPGDYMVSGLKRVRFSSGNLQYRNDSGNGHWQFAQTQYSCLGSVNARPSSSEDSSMPLNGECDLFSWDSVPDKIGDTYRMRTPDS